MIDASCTGAYVPMLALEILKHNTQHNGSDASSINLKGILVGNGVVGEGALNDSTSQRVYTEFYRGHGLVSANLYEEIIQDCKDFKNVTAPACKQALQSMHKSIGDVNIYDIYEPCINSGFPPLATRQIWRRPANEMEIESGFTGPKACIDAGAATKYLNLPNVRSAIHVKPESEIGKWEICSNRISYDVTQKSLMPAYKNIIIPHIRVLIFNGDVDACIPFTHNEWWTSNLNLTVTLPWHPWTVNNQVLNSLFYMIAACHL